jgi:YbgC/YbaW family acyl-CoA thioester hydrolase
MNKEPHSLYKIRFSDCDMFGHLNNARYLDYLINAREDHLKDEYAFDFMKYYKNDLAWVISSHEIVYARPAVYNEMVFIQSTLLALDDASIHIEMIMMNEKQDHVKAIMRSKLIPVNTKTGRREQHQAEFMEWAMELVNQEVDEALGLQERLKQVSTACKAKING